MKMDAASDRMLARSALHLRAEGARRAAERALPPAVFIAAVSVLAAIVEPGIGKGSRAAFLLAGCLPFAAAAVAAAAPVSRLRAAMACDRLAGWPDLAVASVECGGAWGERVRREFAARAASVRFPQLWEGGLGAALKSTAFFALMAAAALGLQIPQPPADFQGSGSVAPGEVARVLERLQEALQRPELEGVRNEVSAPAPSRERLLLEIARAGERLHRAEALNLELLTGGLAGVADAASGALRRGDVAEAARALEEQAAAGMAEAGGPGVRHLEHLADRMPAAVGGALRELARAEDAAAAEQALKRLADALRGEEQTLAELAAARAALLRLASAREVLMPGGEAEPGLSEDSRGGPPGGTGAGAEEDQGGRASEPFAKTDPSTLLPVPGARQPGGLSRWILAGTGEAGGLSADGRTEMIPGAGAGELSRAPVVVEELPARHRQTIRNYFELMRQP